MYIPINPCHKTATSMTNLSEVLAAAIGGTHDTHKLHRLRTHPGNQGRKARAFYDGCNDLPTLMARCRPRLGAKHPEQTASVAAKSLNRSGSP